MAPRLAIEASELRGRTFTCLPGCGFCCLCEPGLTPEERARFTGPLAGAVRPDGGALRIVGQAGPCAVLSASRACTAYASRPRGCRSFPFHTTMGWRVQVNLNRGCPGTWHAGAPAAAQSFDPAEALPPPGETAEAVRAAKEAWDAFEAQARGAGVFEPPEAVRRRLVSCLPLLRDEAGLAAGLALAESGLPVTADNLRKGVGAVPSARLHRFLAAQARETFGQQDAKRLPIYVDPDDGFRWLAFRLRGEDIEACEISPAGALVPRAAAPALPLLPRAPGAMAVWDEHARVLADRDLLYSLAGFMLDRLGYGEPFASAALRELCAALGDLWVRASLLARLAREDAIGAARMERGVAFFDMDFLNAPSLGVAF